MENQSLIGFGDLLKVFRQRNRVKQQELGLKLGVHRNTIGAWERGERLPETRGIIIEIAKHLHLDNHETSRLLEASLTALTTHLILPYPRNLFFTGREEVLSLLHQNFLNKQNVHSACSYALYGMGGVGKTQLAIEYAYQHVMEYAAIFWIGAESEETIISSFAAIADVLHLPGYQETDQKQAIILVQKWLATHNKWLMIWDNVESLELLRHFLPVTQQGAILITTRCQALGYLAQGIELLPMSPEEAALLLLRRAKILSPQATFEQLHQFTLNKPIEYIATKSLIRIMDRLPLALDQAGAYVEETGCSISDYLHSYEKQRAQFLSRRGVLGENHPNSVMATFSLAIQQVERDQTAAASLLRMCAFLHAEAIPQELFTTSVPDLKPGDNFIVTDLAQFDQAVATLRTFSLVQRHPETRTLSIHRLIQTVLQEGMSEWEKIRYLLQIIQRLNVLFPAVTYETWEQCKRLLPHVLACANAISENAENKELADVLLKAAEYLCERAQYNQAELLYKRAIHIYEYTLGQECPQVASSSYSLGFLYYKQGKYESSRLLYERALHIFEQTSGSTHPQIAFPLNGLGLLFCDQGKYTQAELLHERALQIREEMLGLAHPQVASSLNNLAYLYYKQGNYEQSEALYMRALSIWQQALEPSHPNVAYPLNNLGLLLYEQGQYEQAQVLYEQALHIRGEALGFGHPTVAFSLKSIADIYYKRDQYDQAELLYRQALSIWEKALGPEHPDVAYLLKNLVTLYQKQNRHEEAKRLTRTYAPLKSHDNQTYQETGT